MEKYIKLVLPLPFRNISCVKKKNPLNTSIFKMSYQTEDDNVEIVNPSLQLENVTPLSLSHINKIKLIFNYHKLYVRSFRNAFVRNAVFL